MALNFRQLNRIALVTVQSPSRLAKGAGRRIRAGYRSLSLRFKIALFVVVIMTCTSFVLSLLTVEIMNNYLKNEIIKRGEAIGRSIAASAGYSLLSNDLLGLDNLVFKAKASNADIEYAAVVTSDMQIRAHSDMTQNGKVFSLPPGNLLGTRSDATIIRQVDASDGSVFEITAPVVFMNKTLGSVVVAVNTSVLLAAQAEVRTRIFIVFGIILVLGTIASVLLASFIIRPIRELSAGVNRMKDGVSKAPLKIYSDDELGKLTLNFNEMSSTIARQQSKLNKYARDLEEAYVSIVRVVAAAIDAKDPYTHGHSARVAALSVRLGEAIGLSSGELKDLEVACLFHDVGKIKTPDAILRKPGGLDEPEYEEMIQHVEDGVAILDKAPSLRKYIPAVRHHHERQDGKGYPDGLSGEDIPLFASLIAVADTFDAMTTDRPYRKALSEEEALRELVRIAGPKLRADLVAVFVGIINEGRASGPPRTAAGHAS